MALLAALLVSCGGGITEPVPATAQIVTISGDDGAGGTIDPVNVWATYKPRGAVVARLHPGDKATMIRRDGDGVLIQTANGVQGWLTYSFIVELK